nr:MAG TPA: hypothetical protein [Caudoviricetes sp.]
MWRLTSSATTMPRTPPLPRSMGHSWWRQWS